MMNTDNDYNIYWGDLHNHCGITYGFGKQSNALLRAKEHLDFCAITGHAMWPDIYKRNEATAFTIDFHNEGFKKLKEHWKEINKEIADFNQEDFVTFQAYEMHSSEYGDHHIVSPDDALPLVYKSSPTELVKAAGVRALTIAHHIGYTPGYRGIDWSKFDGKITPLVEVCSKHGCSMSETAAFPYYHNMGPRDSHNTVYEGLKQGNKFGFVGSTDHHAGYPGSYGDGKLAVLAKEKTRESIWDALINRRTYAVTGDRIKCNFNLNGHLIGSILKTTDEDRNISYGVEACYTINKIIIYKNLKPLKIINGELLQKSKEAGRYKFRVEMGWGNNVDSLFQWTGNVSVSGGKIIDVERCFRGKSVLAPSKENNDVLDGEINNIDNKIISQTETNVNWQCFTVKNMTTLHPATCSVIFEIDGNAQTEVTINLNGKTKTLTISELLDYGYSMQMEEWHSQAFKVHTAISQSQYVVNGTIKDVKDTDHDFYHMEVTQENGHCAYVTPVYFE